MLWTVPNRGSYAQDCNSPQTLVPYCIYNIIHHSNAILLLYNVMGLITCLIFNWLFSVSQTHPFTWGTLAAWHGMTFTFYIEGSVITAVLPHLQTFPNSKFYHIHVLNITFWLSRCKGLNQTESATFSMLSFWAFFSESVFLSPIYWVN
jgi:hypothetical protein